MKSNQICKARPYLASTEAFRTGSDTPRAFLDRCLAALDEREAEVMAMTAVARETACAAADASTERWKAGKPISPIDGMPVGIKDIIETIDMPTGMGSPLFDGWRSDRDSASVRALREAGAVIVGKTVTTEFAASHPGPTRNPWDTTRTPGGSSSGSAAGVAAGYFTAALGTQVVGSILRPSSFNGVVGFKPTVGAINRGGSHDYMSQSVQGVIGATLEDTWQVAREIADRTGGDPGKPGLYGPPGMPAAERPRRLAFLETVGWPNAEPTARRALEDAMDKLRSAGVEIVSRSTSSEVEAAEVALSESFLLTRTINAWESRWPLNTYRDRDPTKLSDAMLARAAEAEAMTLDDYRRAIARRDEIRDIQARLADRVDGCISLSADGEAPVGIKATGNAVFVVTGSLLGVPTLSLPILSSNNLPLGMQILGFANEDARLFATAAAIADIVGYDNATRA
ncbi:MAG: hypothetical protein RLZ98_1514 [Pseudomonadota bacterium]|jgi:Asp-tRNA(Asn)/Glu-tRNA(Gln) amidotransferase A subunit family amidase